MTTPYLGKPSWLAPVVFALVVLWAGPAMAIAETGVPTLSEWGMILLSFSLVVLAVWRLSGRPPLVRAATPGGARILSRHLLTSVLIGQGIAGLGLAVYGTWLGPLVPHDVIGGVLAGILLGVSMECVRCDRERPRVTLASEPLPRPVPTR